MSNQKQWTTRDGRKIRIKNMSNRHILNTIRMLHRNAKTLKFITDIDFVALPGPNGDMAQLAYDQAMTALFDKGWDEYLPDIYEDLIAEARRRDIHKELADA